METFYSRRRRLPHFDKPWAIYYVTIGTRGRRILSPAARSCVLAAARHFHNRRYDLFAACVMPDHVHLLLQPWFKDQPDDGPNVFWSLGELMHSVKSFSAKRINALEGTQGQVWEEECYDRYVRGDHDLREKFNHILENPWRAKLVDPASEYPWVWTPDVGVAHIPPDVPGKMPGTAGKMPALPGN
jgi:putative transposase